MALEKMKVLLGRKGVGLAKEDEDDSEEDFSVDDDCHVSFVLESQDHLRLLQAASDLEQSKSKVIRACLYLALPIIESHPEIVSTVNNSGSKKKKKVHDKNSK